MHIFSSIVGGFISVFMTIESFFGLQQPVQPLVTASTTSVHVPSTSGEEYQGAVDSEHTVTPKSPVASVTSVATTSAMQPVSASTSGVGLQTDVATRGTSAIDPTAIPIGDGKVSSEPKIGYVYSCQQTFNGGGASHVGDWVNGTTWNLTTKLQVQGNKSWSNAIFSNIINGTLRLLSGNGLPVGEPTGNFPIAQNDPAYSIDRNPNAIAVQSVSYQLPSNPVFAAKPSCVPMGAIGIALDGVAIFNALDAAGRDAVAHEVQDLCDGHPESTGEYHYHGPSSCMPHINEKDTVVGYALDGFPITSLYAANGKKYTNADLDACHGETSAISIDGTVKTMYHYVLTQEYPYTVGCYIGTALHVQTQGGRSQQTAPSNQSGQMMSPAAVQQPQGQQPPQAAIDACTGKTANATCSIQTQQGSRSGMCRNTPDGSFACVPS